MTVPFVCFSPCFSLLNFTAPEGKGNYSQLRSNRSCGLFFFSSSVFFSRFSLSDIRSNQGGMLYFSIPVNVSITFKQFG